MRLTRRVLSVAAALFLFGTAPVLAADDPAIATVTKLYGTVESALKSGASDVKSRVDAVGPTFAEVFDTATMARIAVGPKWKSFTPEQQGAVAEAFRSYFVALYARRLSQAAGGKFDIKPQSEEQGPNRIVRSRVTSKDGDETDVDYVVSPEGRIQDVLLNGNVSEVASMRAGFSEPLKTGGAEALVAYLRERTAGMLAPKPAP